MYKVLGILLLVFSPYSDALFSKLEISMVATQLDHYIEYDHQGAFDFLMRDIASSSGINHQYSVLSYARSRRSFIRKEMSCVLPASSFPKLVKTQKIIQSLPLVTKQFHIYTLQNKEPVTNTVSLNNKVVGIVKNALPNYQSLLGDNQAKIIEVSNLKTLLELLNKGRIDAMIQDSASIRSLLSDEQRTNIYYDPTLDFITDEIKITCHKNQATQRYIESINQAILNSEVKTLQDYFDLREKRHAAMTKSGSPNAA